MNDNDVMKPPAYLMRNIERQQQALQVVQMQYQAALNLAGEWLAESLGVPIEQVVQEWEFDGRQFKRRKAEEDRQQQSV